MKKLSKISMLLALTMGLSVTACTVDGEEEGDSKTEQSSGKKDDTKKDDDKKDDGKKDDGNAEAINFTAAYFDAYLLDYSKVDENDFDDPSDVFKGQALSIYVLNTKLDKDGKPQTIPYDYFYVGVSKDSAIKANDKWTLNDPFKTDNYAEWMAGNDEEGNSKIDALSSSGTLEVTKVAAKDFAGTLKNVIFKEYTCNDTGCSFASKGKSYSLASLDLTNKYLQVVDCSDYEIDDDAYCECWPDDCYGYWEEFE